MATAKSKKNTAAEKATAENTGKKRAEKKPKRAPAYRKPSKKKRSTRGDIPGSILLLVGVLMLFCLATTSNASFILLLRSAAKGAFGKLAPMAAVYLCMLGVQVFMGNKWPLRGTVSFAAMLFIVLLATLLQVFQTEFLMGQLNASGYKQNYNGVLWQAWQSSKDRALGGGALGSLLGYPLWKAMDVVGSTMVLLFLLGLLTVWIIRMFMPDANDRLGQWWRSMRESAAERREERRLEREDEQDAPEYDDVLLVPLPDELLGDAPPRGRKPVSRSRKPPQAAASKEDDARYALPVQPAPARESAPVQEMPAPARTRVRQPTLFIEDILPDDGREPYFDEYEDERPAKKKNLLPDFIARRRAAYNAAYGELDDEAFYTAPMHSANPEPFRFSPDPGAPYREAFRAGRSAEDAPARSGPVAVRTDAAQQPFPDMTAPVPDEPETDAPIVGSSEGSPENEAPEAVPFVEAPVRNDAPLPEEPAKTAEENAPGEDAQADADDAQALTADDELPPWEPVAQEYDAAAEPSRPVRRRRRQETYFPAGNVMEKPPEIPKEERLDRPDWKPPQPEEPAAVEVTQEEEYRQPPFSLLRRDENAVHTDTQDADARGARKLEETLASFGVKAKVTKVVHGPAITRYELQPAPGVKVNKITSLTDDIALNMAAVGVRIEAPIPGKAAVGIEIANDQVATVRLRDVLESDEFIRHSSRLAVALGKDIGGKRIIADLARMPHLLIAGATGSGKSVCINTIVSSIIYRASPEEVRLILIDPKQVELSVYNGIPHLLVPVVTDPKKASGALNWAVAEMTERYSLFKECGVRNIEGYNEHRGDKPLMPFIVVIIDELSDLMMVAPGEVEESICRIAQLARACGIHLVVATQRPSVNVITGIIKANIPSRIAFAVSQQVDSRTILDGAGAEKLLGRGDMLYAPAGSGKPLRVQGCFVSDDEVQRVVDYVRDRHTADYSQAVIDALSAEPAESAVPVEESRDEDSDDSLLEKALTLAVESGQTSISMLQRRLRIGYARAGRIVDEMTQRGYISQAEGSKPREVLITREDLPAVIAAISKK